MPLPRELQITSRMVGKEITGKMFRPYAYETVGAVELETGASAVVIKLYPAADNADFKEPVVVLLHLENLEPFIKSICIVEAGLHPDVRNGG